jgi:formamidopyrimidine-DNA glycosylase
MPELPEVESIRSFLDPLIVGKTIASVERINPKQFHGDPDDIVGTRIEATGRIGKVLHLLLDNQIYICVHLKMSGQLLYAPVKSDATFANPIPFAASNRLPARSTRIILGFTDGSALFFNDMRKFGWIKLAGRPEGPSGPDVLSDTFTLERFTKNLQGTRRTIHQVLLDQDRMAGVGNIYANDALFSAGIMPTRRADSLIDDDIGALYQAIIDTIAVGVRTRGASGKDEVFIMPDASKGGYQEEFRVYQREGAACRVCGTIVKRAKSGGRSVFFCEVCQE